LLGFKFNAVVRFIDLPHAKVYQLAWNLQIVCKFANRSKGASDNEKFLNLIAKIRALS